MEKITRALIAAAELYGMVLSEPQIEGYLAALDPWNSDDVISGLSEAVKECNFFPKPSEIIIRIPKHEANTFLPEPEMADQERDLGKDLMPLFLDYLKGETSKTEWVAQMQYFADRRGVGGRMKSALLEAGLGKKERSG